MKSSRFPLRAVLAALLAMTGASAVQGAEPLKVGFIYVSPIGDAGWTFQHDSGRRQMAAAMGDKVETKFIETVPEGAEAERVIRHFAADGYGLVFTTSFGYMNPTVKVAKRFHATKFEHATGYKRSNNVSTYAARFYEGRTVAGIIAGHMTESNVIGYIASFPIPEVVRGINAFTLALRRIKPQATVKVVWVNTWYDPGKEAEAAKALIDQGADVLMQHTDSPAAMQIAEEKGIFAFGQASDMIKFGPNVQLTSIIDNWGPYYVSRVKAVMDGAWDSQDTWDGIGPGMVEIAAFSKRIPEDVRALAAKARDDIGAGKLHPFTGPINKQDGSAWLAAGETASDGDLAGMNFYIEGVEGTLP